MIETIPKKFAFMMFIIIQKLFILLKALVIASIHSIAKPVPIKLLYGK